MICTLRSNTVSVLSCFCSRNPPSLLLLIHFSLALDDVTIFPNYCETVYDLLLNGLIDTFHHITLHKHVALASGLVAFPQSHGQSVQSLQNTPSGLPGCEAAAQRSG